MTKFPKPQSRPQVTLKFSFGGGETGDIGTFLSSFEYKAMVNGGYIIRGKFFDTNFNRLDELIKQGYLETTRDPFKQVVVSFQLRWGPISEASYPQNATQIITANLLTLKHSGSDSSDKGLLEFVAIDPPSYFLNIGDASGGVYIGRASDVIKEVIKDYAPGIQLDIGKTLDSKKNKWYMMRQDPKTFISSIIDWSPSITQTKTHWIFNPYNNKLQLKEQGKISSKQRAYYKLLDEQTHSDIKTWDLLADHGLSLTQTKLITQGISTISGRYLDKVSDPKEKQVVVKDKNTGDKKIAKIKKDRGFTKPPEHAGMTSVAAIPEIYSAGDLGLRYDEYIDGRPRNMWLNMTNSVMRAKFGVIGHGEWSDPTGLGTDTVYISWTQGKEQGGGGDKYYWMTGNWITYGFHHKINRSFWTTDLYCARFDFNASGIKVGGGR